MDGSSSWKTVPVPPFLNVTGILHASGFSAIDDLHGTITLVASIAVVAGINLRAPDIAVKGLESNHPAAPAVYAK